MRQLQGLVDRDVKVRPVVEDANAAKQCGLVLRIQRVREAEPRLERAVELLALGPVCEELRRVDGALQRIVVREDGVADDFRGDVVVIEHVRLEVPPDPEIQSQPVRGAPVVLQVSAELQVVGCEEWVAGAVDQLIGRPVQKPLVPRAIRIAVHRVRVHEPGRFIVPLFHVVMQELCIDACLHHMVPAGVPPSVGDIVADSDAPLGEVLRAQIAAESRELRAAGRGCEILPAADAGRVRRRVPTEPLVRDHRLVEPGAGEDVVLQDPKGGGVPIVDRRLEGSGDAEIAYVCFVPQVQAELRGRVLAHGIVQLAEQQRLPEGGYKAPGVLRERDRIEGREARGLRDGDLVVAVLIVPLVGAEEEQPVLDQRAADTEAEQRPRVIGLLEGRGDALNPGDTVRRVFGDELERVQGQQILVLVAEEHIPRPDTSTRSRTRRDDGARGLLVFGLEVLGEDAVFLDGVAGERIAATRILPGDTAGREVVLQTRPVNEHVHVVRPLCAGRKVARRDTLRERWIDAVFADDDSWGERRQVEEVPAGGRQPLDLLRGHVRRDL